MQRLTVAEEEAIQDWLLELSSWDWPVRVEQLRVMTIELLMKKGNTADLDIHWTMQFLHQYPQLQMKFVIRLDKQQAVTQDSDIFAHWFELYKATVQKYDIKPQNQYNMNEKNILSDIIDKIKIIISKHEKKVYMTQPGNREWISVIECISLDE